MKSRGLSVLCLAAALAMGLAGCSGKESAPVPEEAAESEPAGEEEETLTALTEAEEQELYNAYVEINNMMVGRLDDVIVRYFTYVDFQEEFVPLGDSFSFYSVISTFYDDMDTADELVELKADKTELDEAYLALSPVMRELALTLDEMEEYMDSEQYLEDDFAKAGEYHAAIWKAYTDYEVLSIDFMDRLVAEASQQREEDMEMLKSEGYEVTYALVSMIQTAQEIQSAIYDQGIEDDDQILELDVEQIRPLCEQYLEQVETALGYLNDEDAAVNEGYPVNSAYFVTFKDAVEMSGEELEAILQRVKEQEPVDSFDIVSAYIVSGTLKGFDSKVSSMIDDYNKMLSY